MINTQDLPSYIPGYEEYLDEIEKANSSEEKYDYSDEYYEDFMIRGGCEIMHREIIDLTKTELNFEEINQLKDYIWKDNLLIPAEMIIGE
jgi:hypothetical protein